MKLIKQYQTDPGKTPEKEFETTLEKELVNLAKSFINVDLIVEALEKGETVYTHWASYRRKEEESVKERIKEFLEKGMNNPELTEEGNENSIAYYRGFINACKFFKLIDVLEGVELTAYLMSLFAKNRKRIEFKRRMGYEKT